MAAVLTISSGDGTLVIWGLNGNRYSNPGKLWALDGITYVLAATLGRGAPRGFPDDPPERAE